MCNRNYSKITKKYTSISYPMPDNVSKGTKFKSSKVRHFYGVFETFYLYTRSVTKSILKCTYPEYKYYINYVSNIVLKL